MGYKMGMYIKLIGRVSSDIEYLILEGQILTVIVMKLVVMKMIMKNEMDDNKTMKSSVVYVSSDIEYFILEYRY